MFFASDVIYDDLVHSPRVCDYSKGIIHTKIKSGSLATHHYIKGGLGEGYFLVLNTQKHF